MTIQLYDSTYAMPTDLGRAFSAFSALGVDPANMSISYLSRSATDRDEFSAGEVLDGGLYNYTIAFAQAPEASAGWR